MAKKKISSNSTNVGAGVYSPTTYLDFDNVKEIEGLKVGQQVRILLTGTIRSLEQKESYDNPKEKRSSICLRDFEAEIAPSGKFDSLLEDDDD